MNKVQGSCVVVSPCKDKFQEFNKSRRILFNFLGALFAAVAAVETVCTLLGAVIFNCLYPFTIQFGFSGLSFLAMAIMLIAPLTVMQ